MHVGVLWGSQAVQRNPGGVPVEVQRGKVPEKFWPFYIWRTNNSLK